MKKMLVFALSLVLSFAFTSTAFAADFSGNAESELSGISGEIVVVANELYGTENNNISSDDIDYSNAFKVYVDTNIFDLETNHIGEIKNSLESGNYIYLVPIKTDNGTIVVNVQKGLPLSDNARSVLTVDEQQEVTEKVGQWVVSSIAFYNAGDLSYDYMTSLSNKIGEIPDDTILVGSLPVFRDVVALIPNNDGVVENIAPVTATTYAASDIPTTRSNLYDYEQIKAYARDLPPADSEMAGLAGTSSETSIFTQSSILLSIAILVSILVFTSLILVNKRAKNK